MFAVFSGYRHICLNERYVHTLSIWIQQHMLCLIQLILVWIVSVSYFRFFDYY